MMDGSLLVRREGSALQVSWGGEEGGGGGRWRKGGEEEGGGGKEGSKDKERRWKLRSRRGREKRE